MPRLLRTPQANDDLLAIWDYIARDSLAAADRFLRKLDETCKLLTENPKMGQLQEQYRPGLRCFSVGNYLISTSRSRRESRFIACCTGHDTSIGSCKLTTTDPNAVIPWRAA